MGRHTNRRHKRGVLTTAYARGTITDLMNRTMGASSTLLSEFGSVQYDSVGNILSVNATIPTMPSYGGTTSYAHDTKSEIKTEQSTAAGGYGYDAAGNQNLLNVYDKAGNPTTYKGVALTFDAENCPTSYGGTTLTNGYRGDSLRAWKQNANGRTYFLYSSGKIVCELRACYAL